MNLYKFPTIEKLLWGLYYAYIYRLLINRFCALVYEIIDKLIYLIQFKALKFLKYLPIKLSGVKFVVDNRFSHSISRSFPSN